MGADNAKKAATAAAQISDLFIQFSSKKAWFLETSVENAEGFRAN